MSEFLVEAYHPTTNALDGLGRRDVAEAAGRLAVEGQRVTLVRAILAPADETCFYLIEADALEEVLESAGRSGLRVLRVLPAVSVWAGPTVVAPAGDRPASTNGPASGERGDPPGHL